MTLTFGEVLDAWFWYRNLIGYIRYGMIREVLAGRMFVKVIYSGRILDVVSCCMWYIPYDSMHIANIEVHGIKCAWR
jgi:hypothetical protein